MNYIDTTKNYVESMLLAVQDFIKHATFDRTFRAKITSQISADKYKILYKNKEYPASCDIKAKIGDMVWVCAPENNWNRLYIQSSKSADDTITQVNGVKGSAETSYKSGYVNISPEDIGLGKVPNVATNDQAPTFTQASSLTNIGSGEKLSLMLGKIAKAIADFIIHKADSVIHITSNDRSLWNTVSNKVESETGKGLSTNDYTNTEQTTLADVNSKKHTHTNKTILDGITQTLIDRWNAAETNVQADFNVTDTASDAFIKNKPTSLPANGGTADMLSNAVQIADYNTFIPTKIASGAITPVKAGADANSPWNNTTSGFLVQSNSADSWHLLIFRSGGDGWAYRSYYQNVWKDWKIWSTFDGKYSSLSEKPTSFPPSTHTHTKSQITDMPTNISLEGIIKGSGSFDGSSNLTISTLPTHKDYLAFPINQPNGYVKLFTIEVKETYANIPIIFNIRGRNSGTVGHDMATIFLDLANSNSKNPPIAHFKYLYDSRYGENVLAYMNNSGEATLIEIWCKNAESYDSIFLTNLSASDPKFKITYGGETTTDEPILEGYTKYTPTMGTISADITGNAATVNGKTVNANVPADAKFTDTVYAHPNSGATVGTYKSVNVNAQGHVTGGTNPTTLAGYGITDAAAANHVHITPTKAVSTSNTSTTNKDKYCKIASFKISSLYGYTNIKYDCSVDAHGSTVTDYIELGVWVKQQTAFGSNPYVYLSLMRNNKAIKYVKFFAVIDELDATYSKVDLYAQITISSCLCTLFELSNVCGGITKVDYFNSSEFLDNLPVGKTVITETDCSAMHDHDEYSKVTKDVTITALTTGWSSTAPYSQTISVSGVKSTDTPSLFPYTPKTLSPTQIKLSRRMFSYVTDAETGNGTITLYCGENKPSSDFDILAIGISK